MIKIGDRIRFLNEVGGGTVSKIINKEMVAVLDEDGFEIPVLMRECVVVESDERIRLQHQPHPEPEAASAQQHIELIPEPVEPVPPTDYGDQLSVLLAFVPIQLKQITHSDFDFYLINDSNYDLLYTLSKDESSKVLLIEHGVLQANTKRFVQRFSPEALKTIRQIVLQFIAYKNEAVFEKKPPFDSVWELPSEAFWKVHSFVENDFFDEQAMVIPLMEKDIPSAFFEIDPAQLQQSLKEKHDIPTAEKPLPAKKHSDAASVVELDLHIEQLLDTTAGLDKAAILEYQLDTFRQFMEKYKHKKGQKLVVIHGKGEGVLRNAIINELKKSYPTCRFQDASFREYGFGATMITIR
ncbi:MAG: DUF2027 domain-containing protein [Microbacter sp.]